jgi:hypothetical protein
MTRAGNRWEYFQENVGGDPGTVTVTGVEGSESTPTS